MARDVVKSVGRRDIQSRNRHRGLRLVFRPNEPEAKVDAQRQPVG